MKYPTLILASIALAFSAAAQAKEDVTPEQARVLCKVVDPVFLNALPVLVEMKNSGKSQRALRGAYVYGSRHGYGVPFMVAALEAMYDSPATTVEGAIRFLEEKCFKEITE